MLRINRNSSTPELENGQKTCINVVFIIAILILDGDYFKWDPAFSSFQAIFP